jgi:hypothetical protein
MRANIKPKTIREKLLKLIGNNSNPEHWIRKASDWGNRGPGFET